MQPQQGSRNPSVTPWARAVPGEMRPPEVARSSGAADNIEMRCHGPLLRSVDLPTARAHTPPSRLLPGNISSQLAGAGLLTGEAAGSTAAALEGAPWLPPRPHAPPLPPESRRACERRCRSRARSSAPCATWQDSPRGQPAAPRASSSSVDALRRTPADSARCGPPCGSRTRRDLPIPRTAGEGPRPRWG